MEIFESAMYIAIGFVPTFLGMEASWKSGRKNSSSNEGSLNKKETERSKKVVVKEEEKKNDLRARSEYCCSR